MAWLRIRKLINPLLLLFLVLFFRERISALDPAYRHLLQYLPYLSLAIVIALSVYYSRARLLCATGVLVVVYYLIHHYLQSSLQQPETLLIYACVSLVQPFYLLGLLFVPERGLLNRYGILVLASLLMVCMATLYVLHFHADYLSENAAAWFAVKPFPGLVLSLAAAAAYLLVMLISLVRLTRNNDDFALVIFSVTLFSSVTLARLDLANISALMFVAASLSLIIALLNSSYDMAYRDELTGLLGRRALNDRLKGLGRQYVLAMMDVDHFKKFNDTHGHDIGDEVLKMVARQIGNVGGGGTAYRYGGEEFCVVFSGKDLEYAEPWLEDVRLDIQDYKLTLRDTSQRAKSREEAERRRGRRRKPRNAPTVSVTISIGMAEPSEKNRKPEEVLKAADQALYKAKKKGRNCLAC